MSSRQLEDMDDAKRDRYFAKQLGITVDELNETNWSIETREGHDGAEYGYYIKFTPDSPEKILKKIKGIDGLCVNVEVHDEPESES